MTDEHQELPQCTECQAGVMHPRQITYFTWLDEELVTVPNFPARVCDVCGRREYDARAISWLTTILDPETGKTPGVKRRVRPPLDKRDMTRPLRD